MRWPIVTVLIAAGALASGRVLRAQEPPPRIPFLVVDLHGTFTRFPVDPDLGASRSLADGELPGAALGGDVGLHFYPLRWRAITFGLGANVAYSRAHHVPAAVNGATTLRPVTERFVSAAPQVSLNFGSGTGWSYLSGGLGQSVWQIIPDGADPLDADQERLKTINYGGGARWFMKKHLAFSFDVRFYAINPGAPSVDLPGSPRTRLLVIGAGASVK